MAPGARFVAGVGAGLVALLLNLQPVEIFPSAHMLIGQVPVLAAAILAGPLPGAIAAALGGLPTLQLWGHAWGFLLLVIEAAAVGLLSRRVVPLLVDSLFWLAAPLYFLLTYHLALGMTLLTSTVVWGKQASNSLMAVLLVQVTLLVPGVRRHLRPWLPAPLRAVPIRPTIAAALALGASVPLFVLGSAEGWRLYQAELARLRAEEISAARLAALDVERSVDEATHAMDVLAASLGAEVGGRSLATLPSLVPTLELIVSYTRPLLAAQVSGPDGAMLVSVTPPEARDLRRFPIQALDRDLRRRILEARGRAVVVEVSPPAGAEGGPLVITGAAVRSGRSVLGYVVGALDLARIGARGRARPDPDERFLVLDGSGRALLDSRGPPAGAGPTSHIERVARDLPPGGSRVYTSDPEMAAGRPSSDRVLAATEIPSLGWKVVADRSLSAMQIAVERAMLGLLGTIVVAIGLVVLGSTLLSRVLAEPLQRLTAATARIAAGDRNARVLDAAQDAPLEIMELSGHFDAMAAGVQRQFAVVEDTSKEKDAFLSVATHELRTPLTALKARLDLTLRHASPEERARLEPLSRQVDKLARLISQLLDASRLQMGTMELEREPVDVGEVVRRVAEPLVAASPAHRLDLHLEHVQGELDELRLEQVLHNLVGNALKYSPEGGPVEISVRGVAGEVEITVADRGIGLPGEKGQFERFSRGDVQGIDGMGIGLHVSDEIVRRHGGSMRLLPREGGGTVALVRLPGHA